MSDVLVSSVTRATRRADVPTEQFSLNFSKIEVSYFPQTASGKLGPAVTAGFDVKANKKF